MSSALVSNPEDLYAMKESLADLGDRLEAGAAPAKVVPQWVKRPKVVGYEDDIQG